MAAPAVNIYVDNNADLFLDPDRRTPFPGPLFQKAHDQTTYYTNMDCTTVANLVMTEDSHITEESFKENAAPSPSSSSALPANEGFSREQTLFLIDLMRQHLAAESDGLPKSLKELNSRLKSARSNKKNLWKETAEKLSSQFSESFCPDKVARKWNTLIDAYKKIKDNNKSTGKGTIRFQFYEEMDDLLAGQHDIVFPVVGTSAGLDVRRPEVLGPSAVTAPPAEAASCSTINTVTAPQTRPHKRRQEQEDILQFLRESEEASQRRHEEAQKCHRELLAQLQSAQKGFEGLMSKFLDKM